ncbi:MAG: sugar transporter permease [Naasia sp.]|jgi:ABC-type sugar transport system permease subunit|uniref:carbohydrate ABC transporter permease n=1 Tax=Naasia sp. TaxID=2546198 RepID=UPI00261E0FCC|nr:sugar ABC transporter permease [Naasia sp.]MCU1570159.1 sugar transporter permease [Naasia sp.]
MSTAIRAGGRRHTGRSRRDLAAGAAFLAPTIALIIVLRVAPALAAVGASTKSGLPGSLAAPTFVGADVFARLFAKESFWESVRQTLVFNILVNPIQIALALALAVLLTRRLPASGLWRTLIFLPSAVPLAGSTIVWGIALRPDGPVNGALEILGLPAQPWFTSPDQVVFSMIVLASWIGIGYWMMFLIAGINDIPPVYFEAARIDGAGALRTFFSVTIPMLRRPLLFVLVADTVANFVLFAPVQILTSGGPEGNSNFLMYDIFHKSYELSDPYEASAELVVLLVIMVAIVAVQFRLLRTPEGEE